MTEPEKRTVEEVASPAVASYYFTFHTVRNCHLDQRKTPNFAFQDISPSSLRGDPSQTAGDRGGREGNGRGPPLTSFLKNSFGRQGKLLFGMIRAVHSPFSGDFFANIPENRNFRLDKAKKRVYIKEQWQGSSVGRAGD